MAKITDTSIRNLRPRDRDYMVGCGDGLYIRVRTSGSKIFILRKKEAGKTSITTLGRYGSESNKVSLAEARRKALNPPVQTDAPNATVKDLCNEYFDRHITATYRRPHHVRGYLDKVIEQLGPRKLSTLTRAEIAEFLKNYTMRGKVAANRVLAIFRQALSYGVEIGWLDRSPAEGLTRRVAGGEEIPRDRTLTDDEIRALWAIPEPHGPLFRFLLLTAQRIGEAQLAPPTNIEGNLWRIPAEHAKNGRAHRVWLSPQALAEIKAMPDGRDRVFAIRSTTGAQAWLHRWCDRNNITPRFTPHDFRRTAATRMNEIGIAPHVVEKILNHTLQGVMGTYNRAEYWEERQAAMLAWGLEVERIVRPSPVRSTGKAAPKVRKHQRRLTTTQNQ